MVGRTARAVGGERSQPAKLGTGAHVAMVEPTGIGDDNVIDGRAAAGRARSPPVRSRCVRRPGRRVAGNLLRVLERPPVRQIRCDGRRPERVAARRRRHTRRRRTALDRRQHHAPRQRPPAQPGATGPRSETTAPTRPRPRRRPATHSRRPRPGDGPERHDACRPSRAAAAISVSPAGAGMSEQIGACSEPRDARLRPNPDEDRPRGVGEGVRPNDLPHAVPAWHHQPEPVRRDRNGRAASAVGQREGAPSHRGA